MAALAYGGDKLVGAYVSSDIKVYPHQVAAALFALRYPDLKGALLCYEGSLGKIYEALLIVCQKWLEGKTRTLLVVPATLMPQWAEMIERRFPIPFRVVSDRRELDADLASGIAYPFDFEGVAQKR